MRWVFSKYPGYNYVKIWSDFVFVSGSHLDIALARNVDGRKYDFERDFWNIRKGYLPDGKTSLTPGPGYGYIEMGQNFMWIMGLVVVIEVVGSSQEIFTFQKVYNLIQQILRNCFRSARTPTNSGPTYSPVQTER